MLIVDIVLLALVLLSTIIGTMRGGTREIIGVMGWIGAIAVQLYFLEPITAALLPMAKHEWLARLIAFLSLLAVTLLVFTIVGRGVSKIVKSTSMRGVDHFLGLIYGGLRGVTLIFICIYAILPLMRSSKIDTSYLETSYFVSSAEPSIDWVLEKTPEKLQTYIKDTGQYVFKQYFGGEALKEHEEGEKSADASIVETAA